MVYVQANILLCTKYMTLEDLFERTLTFQDSLEACYKKIILQIPASDGILHPDYCRALQVLLSQYCEEVLGCKGASGVATPRELKFRRSIEPLPPTQNRGDGGDYHDGNVRPKRQPSPTWAARGEAGRAPLPQRPLAAGEEGQPLQEQMNLLSLDERVARQHYSG